MNLVPENILAAKELFFDVSRLPRHYDISLLADPQAGRSLKYYLLLTEFPELVDDQGLSGEQVFWSRYYWFMRFARLRQATVGRDAGLEQQVYRILEVPFPECNPDWSEAPDVESKVERDVTKNRS
jgi:hypothetical protein